MNDSFYIISEVDNRPNNSGHSCQWPKIVAYSYVLNKLFVSEGCGLGCGGGFLSIEKITLPEWAKLFLEANAEWFRQSLLKNELSTIHNDADMHRFLEKNGCTVKKLKV